MVDKAAEDFANAYNCVFTKCSGFQSPLPLTRLTRRGEAAVSAVATLGPCSSPAIDRLLRFDMSRVNACASLWHLCDADWRPVVLEPAAYRELAVSPPDCSADVCGVVGAAPWDTSSATLVCPKETEVLMRVIEHVSCLAMDSDCVWWVGKAESGDDYIGHSDYDATFSRQKTTPGVSTALSRAERGILLHQDASVTLYGGSGFCRVDPRSPAVTHCGCEDGIRSAALVDQHHIVAQTDSDELLLLDLRRQNTSEPLLRKFMSVAATIRGYHGSRCALVVSHNSVAVLDVSASALVGAMQCTEGHFLDASLLTCHGRSARVCASTSTGMLLDYTMSY